LLLGSGDLRRGLRGNCGGGNHRREKQYEHKVTQFNCSHGAVFYSLAVELSKESLLRIFRRAEADVVDARQLNGVTTNPKRASQSPWTRESADVLC
jgi:hypothetical protein